MARKFECDLLFLAPGSIVSSRTPQSLGFKGGSQMAKKVLALLFVFVLVFPLSTLAFAQAAPAMEKAAKEARWEGIVARSNPDKSTLTVRKVGSTVEKIVAYSSSTQWVSQEHGSKKVNNIDVSQVKDGDRVICKGTWDKDGVLQATLISKRLTN
jgi:hypothetical protein